MQSGYILLNPGFFDRKIRPEPDSEAGERGVARSDSIESNLLSEVSQILLLHKKVLRENPGYPAKRLKTPSGFFAAALRANFAIAKFGLIKTVRTTPCLK